MNISMMKKVLFFIVCIGLIVLSCSKSEIEILEERSPRLPDELYNYSKLELPKGSNQFQGNQVISVFKGPDGRILRMVNPGISNTIFIPDINGNSQEFVKVSEEFFSGLNNNMFFQNNITDKGATLGRVLFYDNALSINNKVSCGSCHHQDKAFADGQTVSLGFTTKFTERNSMAIINPVLQSNLFWDSRARTIHDLSLQPVQNHIEMGIELIENLPTKIKQKPYYEKLFYETYGDNMITTERISDALSQFIGSITTSKSKFDAGNLTQIEQKGFELFTKHCGTCHSGANFAADDSPGGEYGVDFGTGEDLRGATNIGLDMVSKDQGISGGKFRIPSLRNIMLTAPYMHDGRFNSIDEVLDHYASGIKPSSSLDKKLKNSNGSVKFIPINDAEKLAIKSFLHTLTDYEMIKDPKYSDPFVY
jgi:cytochrome c peroxidase